MEISIDFKTLSAVDLNLINQDNLKNPIESVTKLVHSLLNLSKTFVNDTVYGIIPSTLSTNIRLPRAKPIPKEKEPTRWEKFAKLKGIKKRKDDGGLVYDEDRKEWVARYGWKNRGRDKNDKDLSNWLVEVGKGDHKDVDADAFQKQRDLKKINIKKNEMQQRRNLEEAQASRLNLDHKSFKKATLRKELVLAKKANASMGKFDTLDDGVKLKQMAKRKFEPVTKSHQVEQEESMRVLHQLAKTDFKKQKINTHKSIGVLETDEKKKIGDGEREKAKGRKGGHGNSRKKGARRS